MKRTFIDSCVLIAASRLDNTNSISQNAMNILGDPERSFISSLYVKLETLPHAIRNKRELEVEFYETFFEAVQEWVDCNEELLECAHEQIIQNNGLSGIDAIHVAAAILSNADELITAEKPTKPICNVTSVKVITIHQESSPQIREKQKIELDLPLWIIRKLETEAEKEGVSTRTFLENYLARNLAPAP